MMYIYKIDKSLPESVKENNGFTRDGLRYDNIFYVPYRINNKLYCLITNTPPLLINNEVLKRCGIEIN